SMPDHATDLFKRGEEAHEKYLAAKARELEAQGISTEAEVRVGQPAEEILHLIAQREPRLLVLSTHGRSGLSRWVHGSVANRLVREAPVPTLIVRPRMLEDGVRKAEFKRILVPLDGSPLSESALQPAVELAEACSGDLILAEVLQWQTQAITFGVPDVDIARVMRELEKAAHAYLTKAHDQVATKRPVETKLLRGSPAQALIDVIAGERIDLVVMASHTRSALGRAVLGSVADRMLQANAPVLYIRPERVSGAVHAQRGWFCHNCGRASPFIEVLPEDRCPWCRQYLHACGNCVYFDGVACLLKRTEVHDTYPGRDCAYFQFRQTEAERRPNAPG
ncbi:MAG: universal stress protein, partial [Dehalococcoidia bacterium]